MAGRKETDSHWWTHTYCKRRDSISDISEMDSLRLLGNDSTEDFYVAPVPNDDMWKKFDIYPTPPLSPITDLYGILPSYAITDQLCVFSEKLDNPLSHTIISDEYFGNIHLSGPMNPPSSTPSPGLISDCMWSGLSPTKTGSPKPKVTIRLEKSDLSSYATDSHGDYCVDPTSVFPFPVSDARYEKSVFDTRQETESEDSDEEIDVVTVDQMRSLLPKVVAPSSNPNSLLNHAIFNSSTVRIAFDKYEKRPNKVITLKRKAMSEPASPEPKDKKIKRDNTSPELSKMLSSAKKTKVFKNVIIRDQSASRSSSDSDEFDTPFESKEKRAQHNVLERKRRNDLKFSFHSLRDCIPSLESQERAPKVVILQKAVDCVKELHIEQRDLLKRKEYETRRNEALKRRLELLQATHPFF